MIKTLFLLLFVVYTPETIPTDAGTYKVHIFQSDTTSTVYGDFNLTVTEENTIVFEEIAIDAKDFSIEKDVEISTDLIIKMSKARAWNIKTLEQYQITDIKLHQINEKKYEATLYSFDDINTTITISVVDDYYKSLNLDEAEYKIDTTISEGNFRYVLVIVAIIISLLYILALVFMNLHNMKISKEVNKLSQAFTKVKKSKY